MREQTVMARIKDNSINAEIHAESFESAVEMFMEIADAICTQAEKVGVTETKKDCGLALSYVIAERYMDEEAFERLKSAMGTPTDLN